ncbi:MAG: cysteine hydrolase [Telluria sp.]
MQRHLLVIDAQNDFCDLPDAYRPVDPRTGAAAGPALPVPGAHADMLRLAQLIERGAAGLDEISVTLDTHHRIDVAHPTFWQRGDGGAVEPFTAIQAAEVRAGRFAPRDPAALPRVLAYLDKLEAAGRYTLMVWPVHCELGSWGNNLHADVKAAINGWEERRHRNLYAVVKGTNPWTEHYSAVEAEVVDPNDESTQLNRELIGRLDRCDRIYIAGEAGSHCVRATTEHIVDNLDPTTLRRLVLLVDCMSPVAGFEQHQQHFLQNMRARGVELATAADVLPELLA